MQRQFMDLTQVCW